LFLNNGKIISDNILKKLSKCSLYTVLKCGRGCGCCDRGYATVMMHIVVVAA